jgi:hypothetical protein
MQIRIDADNSVPITAQSKAQKRSAAFIVNEVLKQARAAGILVVPKKSAKKA